MIINRIASVVRSKLGIQTKVEKQIQKELQISADKLKGESHDLFVKRLDGTLEHIKVYDSEIENINKEYAKRTPLNINDNPNYDRLNQLKKIEGSPEGTDNWSKASLYKKD